MARRKPLVQKTSEPHVVEVEVVCGNQNSEITGKMRRSIYAALLKDCENEDTARIMSNNDRVCRLFLKLQGTGKLIWSTYDVCPWCKKTIRVDGRCPVCRF